MSPRPWQKTRMALGVSLGSEWMVIGFGMVLLSQKTKFEAREIQRFLLCVLSDPWPGTERMRTVL